MIGDYYYGTGRRKTSSARVFLRPGSGEIIVNGRPLDVFFGLGDGERLTHDHSCGLAAEEDVERPAVDDDLAAAGTQEDTGRGGLAAAGAVVTWRCHVLRAPTGSAAARRADARCRARS